VSPQVSLGGAPRQVFRDGKLLVDQTFADIRARANEGFAK